VTRSRQHGMIQGPGLQSVIHADPGFSGRGHDLTGVQVSPATSLLVFVRLFCALESGQAEAGSCE
jgi:hypothetical protein